MGVPKTTETFKGKLLIMLSYGSFLNIMLIQGKLDLVKDKSIQKVEDIVRRNLNEVLKL